ncbi:MAG TPA: hypothetical protein PK257_02180 [Candidatus Woesebacteria bacterium]|nr:hypothetical protein [Candidatus Woesebacteria bacterium]
MNLLKKIKFSWLFFLLSLLIFVVVFYLVRSFMINFDEMDHLSAVYLMSRGQKLYTNIFATHFPFPFYLAYLTSPFWVHASFAKAITNFHFTLTLFYFLVFISTFFTFKKSSFRLMFSIWIIFLSLILSLYHGNLFLSETFTALLISSILWILIPVFFDKQNLNFYSRFLLIIFASMAAWTQPLFVFLILIPILISPPGKRLKTFLIALIINLIPLIYFAFSGQLVSFFQQAVLFNSNVYSHEFPEQVGNNSMFIQNIIDFFKNEFYLLTHFFTSTQIYQFILNLTLLVFSFFVLFKAKFVHKIVFLILFLSLMSRQVKVDPGSIFNFGSYPLLLFSSVCLLSFFYFFRNKFPKIFIGILVLVCFITVTHDFSPIFKQSLNLAYNYDVFWSYRQRIGEDINKLTKPDEKILVYPHDPDLYFFSQRLPLDRFTYWYPWYEKINEYKQERLSALKNNPPAVIYYGNVAYKDNPKAYADFFPNLLTNYINVIKDDKKTNYWLRSDLKDRLQPLNFSSNLSTKE